MNIEFHYYTIYFLARKAAIDPADAFIIAQSSQLVDHNLISYTISTPDGIYKSIPTQNYGFWDDSFPKEVYIPFHFFPEGKNAHESIRSDGKTNPYNCAANSENVKNLLITAFKTKDLYRIGIGLHTYADSFAHQNFSGRLEKWNQLEDTNLIPSIGHAQAMRKPDDPALIWHDIRLLPDQARISNFSRYLVAVRKIYRYLCLYSGKAWDDEEFVLDDYRQVMANGSSKKQGRERVLDFIIAEDIPEYSRTRWLDDALVGFSDIRDEKLYAGYSRLLWLRDSLLYRSSILEPREYRARENFRESHFFLWQEAAKAHLETAWQIIGDI
ncbi:MAG: hypothetical protein JW874_05995 [Spirochaetales bacterium]|nr:hypothetical protein [Spirochaetales bacterium]